MLNADFDDILRPAVIRLIGASVDKCSKCGADRSVKVQAAFVAGKRVYCNACGLYVNWRYGTVLDNSRLSNSQFIALFFKYTLPDDAPSIAKQLGIDAGTVRDWRNKLAVMRVAA